MDQADASGTGLMAELAMFAIAIAVGGALAARPFFTRPIEWPTEPPAERDEAARAISSLRELEFARAAGTIDPADHARLRAATLREARIAPRAAPPERAPVRTAVVAALLAGLAAALVAASLPPAIGDRAPGSTMTGTLPEAESLEALERRSERSPLDVPTLLALADAYAREGRPGDAARTYQGVIEQDRENVAALNGLALILYQAGQRDGALLAVDRVLALRPRDADALFLKGLALYQRGDWRGAVDVWRVYLDVGEFHPAAGMVRPLYDEAMRRLRAP